MKWILIILILPVAGCTAIVESFDPTRPRGFQGNIDARWKKIGPGPISHPHVWEHRYGRDSFLSRIGPSRGEQNKLNHHFYLRGR